MSNMLQQAIIDAKALKEAALKNAEAEIVEKYAPEVKRVMENILEAEDDMDIEDAISVTVDPSAAVEDPVAMDLPLGAADGEMAGEEVCGCPDKDQMVTIDLDGLAAIAADEPVPPSSEQVPGEELAAMIDTDLDTEDEEEVALEEDALASVIAELLDEEETIEEVKLEEDSGDEEGRNYKKNQKDDEEHLKALEKDINYDRRHHESKKIAAKTKELMKTINALQEQNDNFKAGNTKMLSEMSGQKETIQKLTTTLKELSLQNAKLLYTNEVLKTDSLNERQKQIAVEALQEVKSVEHAKTVFETLQSTVASSSKKRQGRPESLSEVVSNNASMRMPRRKEQKISNPHEQRWKLLAGIK
jgi:hypothetical protein